jgi:hypothetical protein
MILHLLSKIMQFDDLGGNIVIIAGHSNSSFNSRLLRQDAIIKSGLKKPFL